MRMTVKIATRQQCIEDVVAGADVHAEPDANLSCRQPLRMFSDEIKYTQCTLYRVQKIALLPWRTKSIHILLKLLHHHGLHLYRQKYQEGTAKCLHFSKYSARSPNVKGAISIGEIHRQ